MSVPHDVVLRALKRHPQGVTANELAAKLGVRPERMSLRLSKQALYGEIDREMVRRPQVQGGPRYHYLYRAKSAD